MRLRVIRGQDGQLYRVVPNPLGPTDDDYGYLEPLEEVNMDGNPNATVAGVAGAITVLIVWLCGHFGLDVTAEVASAFTTVVAAVVLWAGKRGKTKTATHKTGARSR